MGIPFDWPIPENNFDSHFQNPELAELEKLMEVLPTTYSIPDWQLLRGYFQTIELPVRPPVKEWKTPYDRMFSFQTTALGYYDALDDNVWGTILKRISRRYKIPDQEFLELYLETIDKERNNREVEE